MLRKILILGGLAVFGFVSTTPASAEGDWGKYQAGDVRSGYTYMTPESQEMQDDDFANPAFVWYDYGEELWSDPDGAAGKSCESCHGDASAMQSGLTGMKGVAPRYPVYDEKTGKPLNLEKRINRCRTENMQADPYKWESKEMLSMMIYVKNQSKDMPVNVDISGPMKPFYDAGKEFYFKRRGMLDMACSNCHVDNAGTLIRANVLTMGMANGFPTYRLKWQKPGSLHRRFVGCNKQVRATPYKRGSDEYMNLEVFLTHRGNGLPIETPAVRN